MSIYFNIQMYMYMYAPDQLLCWKFPALHHPVQAEKNDSPAGKRKSPEKPEDGATDVTKKQKTPPKEDEAAVEDPASVEEEEKKEEEEPAAAAEAVKDVDVPEGKVEAAPPAAEAQ